MSEPGTHRAHGRYEVAVDTLLGFQVYPRSGRRPSEKPWIERLVEAAQSREPVTISFEGRRFTWHPGSDVLLPTVTVQVEDSDDYEAERLAMQRFLSALSYAFGYGITVYSAAASGVGDELDPPLLQQPRLKGTVFPVPDVIELADESEDLRLCLAHIREAMSSTSRAHAYLSYWKAIEVVVGRSAFKNWVGSTASKLWPEEGLDENGWFEKLNGTRIAAAHAIPYGEGPGVDPDHPKDTSRLMDDESRIYQLAKLAVEERWPNPVRPTGERY